MKIIDRINSSPQQSFTLLTEEDGQKINCDIRYLPTQRQWILDLQYQDFTLRGIALVNSVNILRNYRNILPFGIGIFTVDGFDPFFVQDFEAGRARFYLLNQSDVNDAETLINEV